MPDAAIPPRFDELIRKHGAWVLPTHNQRWEKRRLSSEEELKAFYDDILPVLGDILAECDRFPLGELPSSHDALLAIAMSAAEISPHVELYRGSTKVPNSFEESKFVASHGDRHD